MSAVVKTHHMLNLKFRRSTPARVLREVRNRYAQYIDDSEELVDYGKTELHEQISSSMSPGLKLRELRIVTGRTLQALADEIGVTPQRVHAYEAGTYGISKAIAKKLAAVFGVSVSTFI
jgi:DNA-binding XRE family transcriptional regulator